MGEIAMERLRETDTLKTDPAAIPDLRVKPVVRIAFYLYVASIPFETVNLGIGVEITALTLALLLAATVFQMPACLRRPPLPFICFLSYALIFAIPVFGDNWAYSDEAVWQLAVLLQLILMCWVALNLMKSHKVAKTALIVFAVSCSALAVLQLAGVSETTTNLEESIQRTTSFGFHPNNVARLFAISLLILIGLTYGSERSQFKSRGLVWILFGVIGLAMIETGSRGGLIAFVAGLSIILLRRGNVKARLRNGIVLAAGVAFFTLIAFESELFRSRFERAMDDGDLARREQIYPTALEMFLERPLLGWGGKGSEFELGARLAHEDEVSKNPHNLVLFTLVATGVVGTLPMLAGLCLTGLAAWKARKGPRGVLPLSLFAMVIVANMSGLWLHNKMHWFVMAYAISSVSVFAVKRVKLRSAPLPAQSHERFVERYV